MNTKFTYKHRTFVPYGKFDTDDFFENSKKLYGEIIQLKGYSHKDFYESIPKEFSKFDLFVLSSGEIVTPCTTGFFRVDERKGGIKKIIL
jgi:hypothetical protein